MIAVRLTIILSLVCRLLQAQPGLFITGNSSLRVKDNSVLFINGNLYNLDAHPINKVRINGKLVITRELKNQDSLVFEKSSNGSNPARLVLTGGFYQYFSSTVPWKFFQVEVNKTSGQVRFGSDVTIKDTIRLISGNVNLYGKTISLEFPSGVPTVNHNPLILGENSLSRFYGDSGRIKLSTIKDSYKPHDLANLGLTIKDVTNDAITIERSHNRRFDVSDGSVYRNFRVSSVATITDSIRLRLVPPPEMPVGMNFDSLSIYSSAPDSIWTTSVTTGLNPVLASTSIIYNSDFIVTAANGRCINPPASGLVSDTAFICAVDTIVLDAGSYSNGESWKYFWSTGDTSRIKEIDTSFSGQTVSLLLRDKRGCETHDSVYIQVAPTPLAILFHTNVCENDSVTLVNKSSITSGSFSSRLYFHDATNALLTDTVYKKFYNTPGKFPVVLEVISDKMCEAYASDTVTIFSEPVAAFQFNYNCTTDEMELFDVSSVTNGAIASYLWNLGESISDTSTLKNPIKSYFSAGTYAVTLGVKSFQGCSATTLDSVTIHPETKALFSAGNSCESDSVDIINLSQCTSCFYKWDFGDGTFSNSVTPGKEYLQPGLYNIKLKAMPASGCSDSSTLFVHVNPSPEMKVTNSTNELCEEQSIYFTNHTNISSGDLLHKWFLNNIHLSSQTHLSYQLTQPGINYFMLESISDSGCIKDTTITIVVHENPVLTFSVPTVCYGDTSMAMLQTSISPETISYSWGNIITGDSSYLSNSAGEFTASITVTDSNQCSRTVTSGFTVLPLPDPKLGDSIKTCGLQYSLESLAQGSHYWPHSGDTSNLTVVNSSGSYSVLVSDSNGCINTDSVTIILNSEVTPTLGKDTVVCGPLLLSSGYPTATNLWNNTITSETFLADSSGIYTVSVTDQNNCIGYDTISITVKPLPLLHLPDDTSYCANTVNLLVASGNATFYNWNTGHTTQSILIPASGIYTVTATGSNGCVSKDSTSVLIHNPPFVFLGYDTTVCSGLTLDAKNFGSEILWNDGSTGQYFTVTSSGNYIATVTNIQGCKAFDTIYVSVNEPYLFSLGEDTSVCSNKSIVIGQFLTDATYQWSSGDTSAFISPSVSGSYGLWITNGPCTTSDVINISILSAPVLSIPDTAFICEGSNNTISLSESVNYQWLFSGQIVSSQSYFTPGVSGVYYIHANSGQCSEVDSILVVNSEKPVNAQFLASTQDTMNKPVQFINLSSGNINNHIWDFGDGTITTVESPLHTFLQAGSFPVSLTVSNEQCEDKLTKSLSVVRRNDSLLLQESVLISEALLFPVPAREAINIRINLNSEGTIYSEMLNLQGQKLFSNLEKGKFIEASYNIINLPNGIYLIRLLASDGRKNEVRTLRFCKME